MACAVVSLALAAVLLWGVSYDWRVGPLRIRMSDPARPLGAAAILGAILLSSTWRRTAIGVLAVCGLLTLAAYARTADPTYAPAGDLAIIELYTIHATNWQLFVGPYSRFGWNHPGPIYFYAVAPFYILSGYRSAGLSAGALAINLAALGVIVWIAVGMRRGVLAAALTAMCLLFMWRAAPMLASEWNPHVLVLPTMAVIVAGAALVAGRTRLLPLLAALATFVVQTHLGLVPTVLAVSALAAAIGIAAAHRGAFGDASRVWPIVNGTLWLLLLLWLLPIAQQLHQTPGNLWQLWDFFAAGERPGQTFRAAFRAWADMLSAVVRPDMAVAWGTRLRGSEVWWSQSWAVVQTLAVALIGVRAAIAKDAFRGALAGLLLCASLVALWSVMRIEDDIYDHLVFWIGGIGALNAALVADAIVSSAWRGAAAVTPRLSAGVCFALWIAAAAIGFQQLRVVVSRSFRPGAEQLASRRLTDAITPRLENGAIGKPLVKIDQPTWVVAAGVLLQLQKRQAPFAVEEGWWFMFGEPTRPRNDETTELTFAGPEMRVRLLDEPAHEVIAERDRVSIVLARREP
jgi:hypothetical protein